MTTPALTANAAIEEVAGNPERLGLTWGLRPGTIQTGTTGTATGCTVILDGDTNAIPAFTLIGAVELGDRVMVTRVPPEGNYITGFHHAGTAVLREETVACRVDAQTTSSSSYSTLLCGGQALTIPFGSTFTKYRDNSTLIVDFRATGFTTGVAGTSVQYGVLIGGTDYDLTYFFFNVLGQHLMMSSIHKINGIPAGTYTPTARWRRAGGTGVMQSNTDDLYTIAIREAV